MLQPPYLKKNDKVLLLAPAGKVTDSSIRNAVETLKRWQLEVVLGEHIFAEYMGFAGTDGQRRSDLQAAIDNPDIAAIICARGGYGCGRIVDSVDFRPLLKHPKWLVGYSDITILHARLQKMGVQSIHGAMSKNFLQDGQENESLQSLKAALFGTLKRYEIPAHNLNCKGCAAGTLIGGNLSLIGNLAATVDDLNMKETVLFLEDIGEPLYNVDRLLNNLKRSGKLAKIAGLVIGQFSDIREDANMFGKTACEVIADYTSSLNIPVCYNFPAGHEEPNYSLYLGRKVQLKIAENACELVYE